MHLEWMLCGLTGGGSTKVSADNSCPTLHCDRLTRRQQRAQQFDNMDQLKGSSRNTWRKPWYWLVAVIEVKKPLAQSSTVGNWCWETNGACGVQSESDRHKPQPQWASGSVFAILYSSADWG